MCVNEQEFLIAQLFSFLYIYHGLFERKIHCMCFIIMFCIIMCISYGTKVIDLEFVILLYNSVILVFVLVSLCVNWF
jgi:hypothetical protein